MSEDFDRILKELTDVIVYKAMTFAKEKHKGQLDNNGKDYFEAHLLNVYFILATVNADTNQLVAGLLHDTLEDTKTTYDELVKEFGKDIADLVNACTHEVLKEGHSFPRMEDECGVINERAALVKLADNLSNISRMQTWSFPRRQNFLWKCRSWYCDNNERILFNEYRRQVRDYKIEKETKLGNDSII